ncbi:UPF0182 family membrane protein [Buchananella hordeovulneris]|uniref:UPF0182 family membrane protein n=1 Tax=Buchananella hordeovulneris TaxID=52770 RepID=UPI0026DB8DC4|nr:UPF0182 family protein [Buchananella hordeovulneris]MDO5080872.1 UPF0182 family protein [Buchananella hordeovulneris]
MSFFSAPASGPAQPPRRPPTRPTRPAGPRRRSALVPTLVVLGVLAAGLLLAAKVWTEVLWFRQLGFTRVLLVEWGAKVGLFVVGFLVVGGVVWLALTLAHRSRPPASRLGPSDAVVASYRKQFEPLRRLSFLGVAAALGVLGGVNLAANWSTVLTFWYRSSFGVNDPQFGLDISFFVFTLPLLRLIQGTLLTLTVLCLVAVLVIQYLYGGISVVDKVISRAAWAQLSVLAAVAMALVGVKYWLDRYSLLLRQNSRFAGASYSDVHAVLPARAILAAIALVVVALFVAAVFRQSWKLPIAGIVVMVASGLVIGTAYPAIVQRFTVVPNAQEAEAPYIQRNIDATLAAYGLQNVETQTYQATTTASSGQLREDSESTASVRLLDPNIISPTFRQLQQNRQYYGFSRELNVDRYLVEGKRRDTVIAVRELNQDGLGAEQRTWVNDHTVYTHGFGVVAAYGNATATDGRPAFWEQGIPSQGDLGEYEPRVYFGKHSPAYSIVGAPEGAAPQELDYPDDKAANGQVNTTYKGDGGPSVGNFFHKLLFAMRFKSLEILFSDQVNSHSQILFDRDPHVRVAKVAPWLTLDEEAYPAVVDRDDNPATPKELVWIVDGYTTTNSYPYSARASMSALVNSQTGWVSAPQEVNYIRNSVKAVVNAYDGSVTLYQWDENDPLVRTWGKVFGGTVTPLSEVSGDLMSHFRYPEDLFTVQRELLGRYHVTDARSFYSGGDFWKQPADPSNPAEGRAQTPYYLTLQMPGQDTAEFSLTSVFIPGGNDTRNVLTGFVAVDSETGSEPGKIREGFGKIRLLELPRDLTVPGPGQVKNIFDSTSRVSTELNLLSQNSSQVVRGNLLTLPVGGGLLYVQPIYVQSAQGTQYPLLRSVLVAFGEQVGFAPTLSEALDQVFGGDSGATTGQETVPDEALEPEEGQTPAPDQGTAPGGTTTVDAGAAARLEQALQRAAAAMKQSDEAMRAGDWTAYGQAQDALDKALQEAFAAQAELGGQATPAPTPTPTPAG